MRVLLERISSSLRGKKMLFTSLGQSVSGKNCTLCLKYTFPQNRHLGWRKTYISVPSHVSDSCACACYVFSSQITVKVSANWIHFCHAVIAIWIYQYNCPSKNEFSGYWAVTSGSGRRTKVCSRIGDKLLIRGGEGEDHKSVTKPYGGSDKCYQDTVKIAQLFPRPRRLWMRSES